MSTRGAIGTGNPHKWRALYNHWDNYPEGRGPEVWKLIKKMGAKAFASEVMEYDDWRAFLTRGICLYCGKDAGQAHSISGTIAMSDITKCPKCTKGVSADQGEIVDGKLVVECWSCDTRFGAEFPDPDAKGHKHNDITEGREKNQITNEAGDPLFIEWVYLVDTEYNMLVVLKGVRTEGETSMPTRSGHTYHQPNYVHALVSKHDLNGSEPDWTQIQKEGEEMSSKAHEKYDHTQD